MRILTGLKDLSDPEPGGEHASAYVTDAYPDDVEHVLATDPELDDTRSQWVWMRFPNGDLVLATYPQGDTYLDVCEVDVVCRHCERPIRYVGSTWIHRESDRTSCNPNIPVAQPK